MREAKLILVASACDANLYQNGPETLTEVSESGPSYCPHFETCNRDGFLDSLRGHQCVMMLGLQAAKRSLGGEISVAAVMRTYGDDIPRPAKGFVYSPDRETFTVIPRPEALVKIAEFARIVIGGSHGPQDNPCVTEKPPAPKVTGHMRYGPERPDPVEDFLANL